MGTFYPHPTPKTTGDTHSLLAAPLLAAPHPAPACPLAATSRSPAPPGHPTARTHSDSAGRLPQIPAWRPLLSLHIQPRPSSGNLALQTKLFPATVAGFPVLPRAPS